MSGTEGVFHDGVVFVGAQDEAEGGVVVGSAALLVVVVDVELELAEVTVGEFADFEIDEDVTLEDSVVENQVDVKMVTFQGNWDAVDRVAKWGLSYSVLRG